MFFPSVCAKDANFVDFDVVLVQRREFKLTRLLNLEKSGSAAARTNASHFVDLNFGTDTEVAPARHRRTTC
jgi:hypothetical protein